MELFCPSCQKKLIIEDQYAGQMMKCPMCQATFTAPALPSFAASPSTLPGAQTSPSPAPGTAGPPPAPAPGYQQFQPGPPPAPREPNAPYVAPARATATTHKWGFGLSPFVVQWVAVGAIFLAFVLTFFTWVWVGLPGLTLASQNGWQVAFNGYTVHEGGDGKLREGDPGASVVSIFYLLMIIPTVLLVIAAAAFGTWRIAVPPSTHMLISFLWLIAGGVVLLTFFLLTLQVLVGFPMEHKAYQDINTHFTSSSLTQGERIARATAYAMLHRGNGLRLTFFFHLVAVVAAGYLMTMALRKTAPVPRVELHW